MQFHIKYPWLTNQIFTAFHQQLKCFNHECQMAIAHSVFKQTDLNVSAQQLQQHTIKICCKMIQISYQWTREANHPVLSTKWCFRSAFRRPAFHVSLIVSEHSISHMIIHWHTHMVHFFVIFTSKLQFSYWFT